MKQRTKNSMYLILTIILFLIILRLPSTHAEGGGTNYPYSGSGDWMIMGDTWVANETIVLKGDLTIWLATLTFNESVTLIMEGSLSNEIQVYDNFYCYNSSICSEDPRFMWVYIMSPEEVLIDNTTFMGPNWTFSSRESGTGEMNLQNCSFLPYYGTYYQTSNLTFLDDGYSPLEGAIVTIQDQSDNLVNTTTLGSLGAWMVNLTLSENSTLYKPFSIEVLYNGKYAYRVYLANMGDETYIFTEFKTYRAIISVHFFNTFTALGEDAELLKVYYRENNGSWVRSASIFTALHNSSTVIDIQVNDYYNMTVATETITLGTQLDHHIDISVPLATVTLENTLGLNEFRVTRVGSGSEVQVVGHEFKIIAMYTGNSTLLYNVSWEDTHTRDPYNGTDLFIPNGSFLFTAEADAGAPGIIKNLSAYMDPTYSVAIVPSGPTGLLDSEQAKKILLMASVIGAILLPIAIYRNYEFVKKQRRGAHG